MGEPSEKPKTPLLLSDSAPPDKPPISLLPVIVRPPTPSEGKKKPDVGWLGVFVGLFGALVLTLLAMDHVEINWKWSAFAYVIFIMGLVWTFLSHAIPHLGKFKKITGSLVIIVVFGSLACLGVHTEYIFEHTPKPTPPTDTNVLAAVSDLKNVLATNQADPQMAALISLKNDAISEGNEIQNRHQIVDFSAVNLNSLRNERSNELDLQQNQKKQAAIQKQIDDIQKQQSEEQQKQQSDKDTLEKEKSLAAQILPIFDHVIGKLDKMLADIVHESIEQRFSDFPSVTPSIYASKLVKDGRIINGTNFLSIGTNPAWMFEISTTAGFIDDRKGFSSISVVSRTTNGESIVTIKPIIVTRNSPHHEILFTRHGIPQNQNEMIGHVSITLNVPNGLNMSNNYISFENCENVIDKVLRSLIEAQDQQSPIK